MGIRFLSKKRPIHSIKVWAHELGMVVVFLEDLRRKKQVHAFAHA
jgi:hypothetical protein